MSLSAPPMASRDLAQRWSAVLGRLEVELTPQNYAMWFKGSVAERLEGEALVVRASSERVCTWLNDRMSLIVERALEQSFPRGVRVRFIGPAEELPAAAGDAIEPPRRGYVIGRVNCSYTFEDHVAAEGNRLARQLCLDIVEGREWRPNPLVLSGSPGMGKTHLLHALACEMEKRGKAIALFTAEEFVNRYMNAVRAKRVPEFHAEMRAVDLLMIDDLQQLVGKPGSQDELGYTMDAVVDCGGGTVMASERDPLELELSDRLASRISMGIICRVSPLLRDERREFIERYVRRHRVSLPAWAIDRVAACEAPSVRVLMGAVNSAIALERSQSLDIARLDESLARVVIAEARSEATGERELLERIARHFAVKLEEITGRAGGADVREARALAVAALHERGHSLSRIGAQFDGRDKGTLSVLAKKGRSMIHSDERLRLLVG
ncbi:MAG TPA: DnaA/Hda family protein [Tepidiformaceae bacterium]|nr:DnaA/Hda family protein [Tepidiformaceae bacterium]